MKKILLSLLTAISFGTTGCSAQSDGINVLSPKDFIEQAKADTTAIILDVRTPEEYKEEHLAGARQLDFQYIGLQCWYQIARQVAHLLCILPKRQAQPQRLYQNEEAGLKSI